MRTDEDLGGAVRRYSVTVWRVCMTYLHDPTEAEVPFRDAFVGYAASGEGFAREGERRAWLVRAAKGACEAALGGVARGAASGARAGRGPVASADFPEPAGDLEARTLSAMREAAAGGQSDETLLMPAAMSLPALDADQTCRFDTARAIADVSGGADRTIVLPEAEARDEEAEETTVLGLGGEGDTGPDETAVLAPSQGPSVPGGEPAGADRTVARPPVAEAPSGPRSPVRRPHRLRKVLAVLAVTVLSATLVCAAISYVTVTATVSVESEMAIVDLGVNRYGITVRTTAGNDVGADVLTRATVGGMSASDSVVALVDEARALGYVGTGREVLLTVSSDDLVQQAQVSADAGSALSQAGYSATPLLATDEEGRQASAVGVTIGRYEGYLALVAMGEDVSLADVADESLPRLAETLAGDGTTASRSTGTL